MGCLPLWRPRARCLSRRHYSKFCNKPMLIVLTCGARGAPRWSCSWIISDDMMKHCHSPGTRRSDFHHLPGIWLDLATIHQRRSEAEAEITAAQRAFEINPGWSRSAFALAGALERHRELNEAKVVYERALRHTPSDPQLHVQMASILWRLRQPKEALASIENALRLASNASWAWNLLIAWSKRCGQPERSVCRFCP